MAWRRPPRRFPPRQRPPRPARPRPAVQQQLRRAHAHLMAGNFTEAAAIFDRLAEGALARGLPEAPRLTLKAAEAHLKAGNTEAARERALRGLEMLANTNRWPALRRAGEQAVALLNAQGETALAAEIQQAVEKWLAAAPPMPQQHPHPSRARPLPATCPACGAPVHPDDVTWEADRAFCPYCGAALA